MSKKNKLAALAILGISSTMFLSADDSDDCGSKCSSSNNGNKNKEMIADASNANMMSAKEQTFCDKLHTSAQSMFKAMNKSGRECAMEMAEAGCKGKNSCKGKGGCKTDSNACKGKNSCKGKGGCAMDGNKAVQAASSNMADKRMCSTDE